MTKSQPTYTKEFKQQAVHLFETSGKSKIQIRKDHSTQRAYSQPESDAHCRDAGLTDKKPLCGSCKRAAFRGASQFMPHGSP